MIILIILVLLFYVVKIQNIVMKKIYKTEYAEYVYKYSQENEIDPLLTFAIIKAESNFQTDIISSSGAIGLMQLMPATAEEVGKELGETVIDRKSVV